MAQQHDRSSSHQGLMPEGAFVVTLRSDSNVPRRRLRGRVEHVVSGQSEQFTSIAQLLAFMARHAPGGAATTSTAVRERAARKPAREKAMRRLYGSVLCIASVAALTLSTSAGAQPVFDHLKCYAIKDPLKGKYSVDLNPEQAQFLVQTGCKLKAPAKLLCTDVEKTNVQPTPPLQVNGANARDYLCYKLTCPILNLTLPVEDQFGQRVVVAKKPRYLCAPAREVGVLPSPTPTAAPPQTTPTPTAAPSCSDGMMNGNETGVDCGGGVCPQCVLNETCTLNSDCVANSICTAGVCGCAAGRADCNVQASDGCEVNTSVDAANCGVCGHVCFVANGTPSCTAGSCTIASCNAPFANCNSLAVDGCETNRNTDVNNCGACGHVCAPGQACVAGACQ